MNKNFEVDKIKFCVKLNNNYKDFSVKSYKECNDVLISNVVILLNRSIELTTYIIIVEGWLVCSL